MNIKNDKNVDSEGHLASRVVKPLKRCDSDRHGLGSKFTRTILLCSSERHFFALSPALPLFPTVKRYRTCLFSIIYAGPQTIRKCSRLL